MQQTINVDLQTIKTWCDSNLLSFNINKTNILTFRCSFGGVYLGEQPVESQPSTKFFGLIIDSGLKFEDHIVKLNKRLSSSCYAVRVASAQLGVAVARIVYYSLFESHLRYGIAFWGFCSRQLLNSAFVVQKRAVRYMC